MKKAIKILLPLMIIGLLVTANSGLAETYGVAIGNTYTYDVVASNVAITVGTESASASGYTLGSTHFDEGTSVTVNVTAVGTTDVDYDIISGAASESEVSSTLSLAFTTIFYGVLFPLLFGIATTIEFNTTEASEDPGILMIPFVSNETDTFDSYIDMANDIQAGPTTTGTELGNLVMNATYTDEPDEFFFEFYMGGNYIYNDTIGTDYIYSDMDIEHHYQFAYQKTTGVMLGIRVESEITGTNNGTAVDINVLQHTELDGYNLPNYAFHGGPTWPFPGFEVVIAITAIGSVALAAVLIRKRK
ncbi:MAG: hypothetical protein FK734_17880 [Asgard group archaeon]|nr:hypothetical protein [Asgard group archaeon]